MLGGLLNVGMGLYGMYAGQQAQQKGFDAQQNAFNPYDVGQLRTEQQGQMEGYQGIVGKGQEMYDQGKDHYAQGQQYMDMGGQQNQLMRRTLQNQSMDAVALQNTMNRRNPNGSSGLQQQQLQAQTMAGQGQANNQFLQGYANNQKMGASMMTSGAGMQHQGVGAQQQGYQGQTGLVENIQQAQISNQDMQNEKAASNANYYNNQAAGLFGMTAGMGGGLNDIGSSISKWWDK